MTKRSLLLCCTLLLIYAQVRAAESFDLAGNEYSVYIFCNDDMGDYCRPGRLATDTFVFDGGNFAIESLESTLWGLAGDGDYSAGGFIFDAEYAAIDGTTTYEFDITGFNVIDIVIFGTMDIALTEYDWTGKDTTRGEAFFFGLQN